MFIRYRLIIAIVIAMGSGQCRKDNPVKIIQQKITQNKNNNQANTPKGLVSSARSNKESTGPNNNQENNQEQKTASASITPTPILAHNTPNTEHGKLTNEKAQKLLAEAGIPFDLEAYNKKQGRISTWSPLHWAIGKNNLQAVELFIKNGADINGKDDAGNTPLEWSACVSDVETFKILLKHYDVNEYDRFTLFRRACCAENSNVVNFLLNDNENKVNVSQRDIQNRVKQAAILNDPAMLGVLLQHCDTSWQTKQQFGYRLIELAVREECVDILELLLKHFQIDINESLFRSTSIDHCALLHIAAEQGREKVVTALLNMDGINKNVMTLGRNVTPLHLAAQAGHPKIVQILIDNNADCNIKDSDHTPFDLAKRGKAERSGNPETNQKYDECIQILEKAMNQQNGA
ncbi:ankyrin repeat domain-containing protein [Cardinium endosymbiont of Culicoides punctatus]|uniref:ankyrin repeat domain-containing protein n=1 Tax=Cardinium endosymbiont of Culicoides punctatus TaxID=2304601 RepID=UPI00105910AE|nr:ankyrin repeat domain-containing protein [Cardinium endosymbiont of Culicoides punctatus]TDG95623.1 hypothetical protein CCPUN_02420 [Cardinium endosymbiont of Culicoides punctatus]